MTKNHGLIPALLLNLCVNYPFSNRSINVTPPPWKFEGLNYKAPKNETVFDCILKNSQEIRKKLLADTHLKIGTMPFREPLSHAINNNGTWEGRGLAFEVVETLRKKFGFTYEIVIPKTNSLLNTNGSIVNILLNDEVDMVAALMPFLPGLELNISYGNIMTIYEYGGLMKRPKESATGSGLLAPFETEVWLLILLSLVVVGPVMHFMMKLRNTLCGSTKVYPLSSCIWFVYGALMRQGSSLSPENVSTRVMFGSWWIFIMILTSFYTANLTAFLTLSRFTLPISSMEDIARTKQRWIALEGDYLEYGIKVERVIPELTSSWVENRGIFINETGYENVESYIKDGGVFLHDRKLLNFKMLDIESHAHGEGDRCKYVLAPDTYYRRPLAFMYPKNSILPDLFSDHINSYLESGIIKHLITKDLPEATICPLNLGNKELTLSNTDLYTTYAIVIVCYSAACAIFITEIISKVMNRRRKATLRFRLLNLREQKLFKAQRSYY